MTLPGRPRGWPLLAETLLRRPERLRGQPLEDNYKRKLEAVALLLQPTDALQLEIRARTSLRHVKCFGPEALHSRARNYRAFLTS